MATLTLPRSRARLGLGVLAVAVALVAGVLVWRLTAQPEAPYADPASTGVLTLCSAQGEAVTSGKTGDRPFADVVLGESGLPDGTDPTGAVATLYAYQPREGVSPAEYSGTAITAATPYADPARPATEVTAQAWSLGDFVTAFPAGFDGYVQLRLVLGTPGLGSVTDHYDTADIKVDGDSWELVGGGHASCKSAGKAVTTGGS
ncbi:hypothetical protein [Pimelobacter simplex]|uniref:hypothetical protein n=1 Tax=Nocardioides simplex TaxID=2045 RepID=UPI003AAD0181